MNWKQRIGLIVGGALAGLLASVVMLLLMAATRRWLGVSPPPEAVPDRLAPTISIDRFFDLFAQYGGYNGLKRFGVWTGIRAILAAGLIFGTLYSIVSETVRSRSGKIGPAGTSRLALLFITVSALVVWVGTVALLWPVLGANYKGLPPSSARLLNMVVLGIEYIVFGMTIVLAYRFVAPVVTSLFEPDEYVGESRSLDADEMLVERKLYPRRAVVLGALAALAALPTIGLIRWFEDRAAFSYDGRPYSGPGVKPIAPNEKFYSVTKNVVDPDVDRDWWKLEITGLVDNEMKLSFDDLTAFGSTDQETTLMCISNRIGSGLFSNAVWTGVPMADLLNSAGVKEGAVEVKLRAADGYSDTFSIEKALDPTTMVVFGMNGEPLPRIHGFPVRVIVPGMYGEKNVKWVTGIEVIDHDGKGFYEQQGWGPDFFVPTRSDIFSPQWRRSGKDRFSDDFKVNTPATIRGRAFAGSRGVKSVEFSSDNGESWNSVVIDYPGTKLTWTFWSYTWIPRKAGEYTLTSRAVDGDGQPQIEEKQGIVPQGARGYHRVVANVA